MHCRILQNHVRDLALPLGHIRKGAGLRCLQSALNNAVVLHREETFGMNTHSSTLSSSVLSATLKVSHG